MTNAKANDFETGILELILENTITNTTIAAIGSGMRGALTADSLWLSLHDGTLDDTSSQNTTEVTTAEYDNYAREELVRAGTTWTTASGSASNTAAITWTTGTGGTGTTATDFAIGTEQTGAGNVLYYGSLTVSLVVGNNVTPEFAIGALVINET